MLDIILFAIWFFLPAGVANVTPILAGKIPVISRWNKPLDLGKKFRGRRIFGPHKTIRGIAAGTIAGMLAFAAQVSLYQNYAWAQDASLRLDYTELSFMLGFALAFGALLGDAVKSFFKRQADKKSGQAWVPFDQIDYILGGLLLSMTAVQLKPAIYVVILFLWFGIHLMAGYLGYLLKLKKDPI